MGELGSLATAGGWDVLLFEVVPYYLKGLNGVSVLFAASYGENSKHRGFI